MHSFIEMVVVGAGLWTGGLALAMQAPTPGITPGPKIGSIEVLKRDGPDAISLANILLTAVPESLRQIAATNVPAVSSILWDEFLDDKKPDWFTALPSDIQNYLISQFGPETAWPTATGSYASSWFPSSVSVSSESAETSSPAETSSAKSTQASRSAKSSDSTKLVSSVSTASIGTIDSPVVGRTGSTSISSPTSESSNNSGLSRQQKIGIGVGVPFAVIGALALAFGCCLLLRRRRKSQAGSIPPSSPGFIPRFAFQEKSAENLDQQHPLFRETNNSNQDLSYMGWDDDIVRGSPQRPPKTQPIMAPALFHTHSSNRARGKRTSYTSLHSVPEVSEPSESGQPESPVLPWTSPPRRNVTYPPLPMAAQVKRKPVPIHNSNDSGYVSGNGQSPAAELASQSLLRQTMRGHTPHHYRKHSSSSVSPIEERTPSNPFSNDYSYVEDYDPEFHNGYIENGLYGGNQDLSRYPEPRKSSKTEWPLRNNGARHQRNKSPLWDRVYDGN